MLGPDGGFNGSVISFSFFPFICFFDLSFAFQLAACDRFFLESIEFPLSFFPNLSSHIFLAGF